MTKEKAKKRMPSELVTALEKDLSEGKEALIGNEELRKALGYVSMSAFRQALYRKTVPVPVFSLPNQRGKFALVRDVARWLAERREAAAKTLKLK